MGRLGILCKEQQDALRTSVSKLSNEGLFPFKKPNAFLLQLLKDLKHHSTKYSRLTCCNIFINFTYFQNRCLLIPHNRIEPIIN